MNTWRKSRALFKQELHMILHYRTQDRGAKLWRGRDFPVLKETCMLLEKSEPCRLYCTVAKRRCKIICIILWAVRPVEKGHWVCNVVDISKHLRETTKNPRALAWSKPSTSAQALQSLHCWEHKLAGWSFLWTWSQMSKSKPFYGTIIQIIPACYKIWCLCLELQKESGGICNTSHIPRKRLDQIVKVFKLWWIFNV